MNQQPPDFAAAEHGRQFPVILRPDLRKDLPFPVLHEIHEKEPGRGRRLTDRLWLPVFDCLHMQDVVAQVFLGKYCGIGLELPVKQPQVTVIGMPLMSPMS